VKMVKNYITPIGLKKLMDEFDHLKKVERPEVTRIVTWAASLGDRSENADYQYGKKRLKEIDDRLKFLNGRIKDAEVVDPVTVNTDRIQFGATVKVEGEDGEEKTFSIVGADETNSTRGLISWKSPVGKALLGKEIGDQVTVRTPKGEVEYEILEINYQELKAGE